MDIIIEFAPYMILSVVWVLILSPTLLADKVDGEYWEAVYLGIKITGFVLTAMLILVGTIWSVFEILNKL